MSFVNVAIIGGAIISANSQSNAANSASKAQTKSAQKGIDEQRRQFEEIQKLLSPYISAGNNALASQLGLVGLGGEDAEKKAIDDIQNSPTYKYLTQAGEEAILSNASATSNLRGGNTQAALAKYRPKILSDLIDSRYQKLGGLSTLGQNSAAGVGAFGAQASTNISNLYGQQGAAQAGSALANGQAWGNLIPNILEGLGNVEGAGF